MGSRWSDRRTKNLVFNSASPAMGVSRVKPPLRASPSPHRPSAESSKTSLALLESQSVQLVRTIACVTKRREQMARARRANGSSGTRGRVCRPTIPRRLRFVPGTRTLIKIYQWQLSIEVTLKLIPARGRCAKSRKTSWRPHAALLKFTTRCVASGICSAYLRILTCNPRKASSYYDRGPVSTASHSR